MPAAATRVRMIHRAVPRSSGSAPNAAVQASVSMISGLAADTLVTLTRSLSTVAAGFRASVISLIDANLGPSNVRLKPDTTCGVVPALQADLQRPAGYSSNTGNLKSSTDAARTAVSTI